jgi:hypothetical protein
MPIPNPKDNESRNEFMQRCMSDEKMISEYPSEQRAAICNTAYDEKLSSMKVSFDFDGVLTTSKGIRKAIDLVEKGVIVYIISARSEADGILKIAKRIGIPENRVHATGSNQKKIWLIQALNITTHYDNNIEVVRALPGVGAMI